MAVVKGYYASICHGLTFLGSIANMVIGLLIAGAGAYLAFDFVAVPYGLSFAGIFMIGTGVLVLLNGVMAMFGGCKAQIPLIKIVMYLSILQILVGLAALGIVMSGNKPDDKLRLAWKDIPEPRRAILEEKLQCCGYNDTNQGVEGCKHPTTCSEYIPAAFKKRVSTGAGILAAGLLSGALALFGSYCLQRKMSKTEGKSKKKAFTSLQDEARGIDRSKRPKRPPRSERTPHAHDNV